ncbi:hypothetical protein AACH10_11400 [Ideonella sp. DXS22W]|uniref:Uncharacterized protein n=1 Tax=Pseudaquabacterium inlustre TaxID=2984192 RepID=A0ABU9CJW9_9BURK
MRALIGPLLLGSTSLGCALAAAGVALHGAAWAPALLYGGFGAVAGLVCTLLQHAHHGLPVHDAVAADGPGEAPAAVLARTMLAELARASAAEIAARRARGPGAGTDAPAADEAPAAAQALTASTARTAATEPSQAGA